MKPRLRFAPSPSGYLHIRGARDALFDVPQALGRELSLGRLKRAAG
jgi:glutamyl/glutaminyl-tRNA synthetase